MGSKVRAGNRHRKLGKEKQKYKKVEERKRERRGEERKRRKRENCLKKWIRKSENGSV
jgi:hypothetical protein